MFVGVVEIHLQKARTQIIIQKGVGSAAGGPTAVCFLRSECLCTQRAGVSVANFEWVCGLFRESKEAAGSQPLEC